MFYFKKKLTEFLILRIGTRGSPLALRQAHLVQEALMRHPVHAVQDFQIVPLMTQGDQLQGTLADFGGKGLFTKELDVALLRGDIDVAVHSMKDVATTLLHGVAIPAMLPREDPRDAWISPQYPRFQDLPQGARVGTCSLRRAAQIHQLRPDVKIVPLRGNVGTRFQKIQDGAAEGTLLALAGLNRLGVQHMIGEIFSQDVVLPAVAQGAIGIACRAQDTHMVQLLQALNHVPTASCVAAERCFLQEMDGSCRAPLAAHAQMEGETLSMTGMWASPDGRIRIQYTTTMTTDTYPAEAIALAKKIKQHPCYQSSFAP